MSFEYSISPHSYWPPNGRPHPPFGPTAIDVMQACPLRSCFEYSSEYERRMGAAARIGTAMHKALQSLCEQPIEGDASFESISGEARRRFLLELDLQKNEAVTHYRERYLLWDNVRIDRALEAVVAEAIRTCGSIHPYKEATCLLREDENQSIVTSTFSHKLIELPAVEIPVQSRDQFFRGRIDRAERIPEGIRIVDYKSAYRDDLPERYARQIQFYAYLWHETTGEWPVEGQVFYPLKGTFHRIPIDKNACNKVVTEAISLYQEIEKHEHSYEMALPGDGCKVCDYRPWCKAFWDWQASEKVVVMAKEKAAMGFEGKVENIKLADHYWRLIINWRNIRVRLIAPEERFPHLANLKEGQLIRIIDASLKGALNQPVVQVFDYSEIFLVY